MKKTITLLLLSILTFGSIYAAVGDTFDDGTLSYKITAESETYEVEVVELIATVENLKIPENISYEGKTYDVTSIGMEAFDSAKDLLSVVIGNKVKSIGDRAFQKCENLTNLTLGKEVENIRENAFYLCKKLNDFTFGSKVRELGYGSFKDCAALTTLTFPTSVTKIGDSSFENCTSLKEVKLGDGLNDVGENTFRNCTALEEVEFGSNTKSIGDIFYFCQAIKKITCKATVPPTLVDYTYFDVQKSIPVYVPAENIEDYKAADYWSEFTNIQALAPSGLQEIAIKNISISGNTVSISNVEGKSVNMYDVTGKNIFTQIPNQNQINISVPKSGIYILKVADKTRKIRL